MQTRHKFEHVDQENNFEHVDHENNFGTQNATLEDFVNMDNNPSPDFRSHLLP